MENLKANGLRPESHWCLKVMDTTGENLNLLQFESKLFSSHHKWHLIWLPIA